MHSAPNLTDREQRGLELASHGHVGRYPFNDGLYVVAGSTGHLYLVRWTGRKWTCDCPDAANHTRPLFQCKHGLAVGYAIAHGLVNERH